MMRGLLCMLFLLSGTALRGADDYKLGPDSMEQPDVAKGKVTKHTWTSKIFPGTVRDYWVYVPAQYDGKTPACLMVFQDGHFFVNPTGQYRIPVVFDNLIYRREMPVTIGVFINPGRTPDQKEATDKDWGDRTTNRGTEYNELT